MESTKELQQTKLQQTEPQHWNLRELWEKIRREYFPELPELDDYHVFWSRRNHRSTLASCNITRRRVGVAGVLAAIEYTPYLEPLLYHEMCHAALGKPKQVNGRRIYHGREFRALERRHPDIQLLNQWIKNGGWHKAVRTSLRTSTKKKSLLMRMRFFN